VVMANDPLQQPPENREAARAFTHRMRDRLSIRSVRLGKVRMWLFLLVFVFIVGVLIFGIPKP